MDTCYFAVSHRRLLLRGGKSAYGCHRRQGKSRAESFSHRSPSLKEKNFWCDPNSLDEGVAFCAAVDDEDVVVVDE